MQEAGDRLLFVQSLLSCEGERIHAVEAAVGRIADEAFDRINHVSLRRLAQHAK